MKCLLIFGMKFGSDNQDLFNLGDKIKALGVDVSFVHWNDPTFSESDIQSEIIIGHSFGGNSAALFAKVSGTSMKYLALIDPVDPAWFPLGLRAYWKKFTIPSNVEKADCFQRTWPLLPPSGTIGNTNGGQDLLEGPLKYRNFLNINASHADIPDNSLVSETILNRIRSLT